MSAAARAFGLRPPTEEEKKAAIEEPGVPWRDWFFFSFLKPWVAIGYLTVDAFIVGAAAEAHSLVGIALGLAAATYLEFLGYRVLWTRPSPTEDRSTPFHPSWHRPVRVGRWTPEAWYPERYRIRVIEGTGPDPADFL
jgi:threonine/homoserine/homoserine lactone efflux protein